MKKRITCLMLSVIILLIAILPVYAINPRWSYTNSVTLIMNFKNGIGHVEGTVLGYYDVTEIEGTITIYRKNILGSWTKTGDTWSLYSAIHYMNIDGIEFDAESGKTYKAVLDVDVYSGSNSENITDETIGTCP